MKAERTSSSVGKLVKDTVIIVAATKVLEVTANYAVRGIKAVYDSITGNAVEKPAV